MWRRGGECSQRTVSVTLRQFIALQSRGGRVIPDNDHTVILEATLNKQNDAP